MSVSYHRTAISYHDPYSGFTALEPVASRTSSPVAGAHGRLQLWFMTSAAAPASALTFEMLL